MRDNKRLLRTLGMAVRVCMRERETDTHNARQHRWKTVWSLWLLALGAVLIFVAEAIANYVEALCRKADRLQ